MNPPTFENAKFDALIGKDVMKQLLGLFFDLSSGIVSIGKTNVPQRAHMFNLDMNLESVEVSRIKEMAKAFEQKGINQQIKIILSRQQKEKD